jgi:hypothetical protein
LIKTTSESMQVKQAVENALGELEMVLLQIGDDVYTTPCKYLFNATIGQHVRHIIELFQSMAQGYETGTVNYDKRKRDPEIENDKRLAIALMQQIAVSLDVDDRDLMMETSCGTTDITLIRTNYLRELYYNLEHCIHHMALIRVGVTELTDVVVPANFGLAPSTIQYRRECVQ